MKPSYRAFVGGALALMLACPLFVTAQCYKVKEMMYNGKLEY